MIGTTLNQRFTLETELGRGGMGAVYRATDQVLQRSVAIKVLKEHSGDDFGKQIRLEAQILARLLHENIVRVYDFGESNGTFYFVMEEVDGTSYLKRWRLIALEERLRVIAQVAEALDYAHHQGVIHRDVKPANVLLTSSDQPKLSDFGLSMLAEERDQSGVIRGTPHYMSPEQSRGRRLDHRTDLYSLGVMLYESAAGGVPFIGNAMAIIAQHVNEPPPPPRSKNPEISPELEALILNLLEKEPTARPVSGQAVASRLREILDRERLRREGESAPRPVPSPGVDGVSPPTERLAAALAVPAASASAQTPLGVPRAAAPLVKTMLEPIVAVPIVLSPNERYLCGHYLAYLLGGSLRKGIFLRRPLDPRNADRARLLLAMTYVMAVDGTEAAVARAVELLESKIDVRPSLSPVVVMRYLEGRSTPVKRKQFRQLRKLIQDASEYGRQHMLDTHGLLNPGLMPQKLDDLQHIAPVRTEVDDELVARWNRVTEAWRDDPDFRYAVLRYATKSAFRDAASAELWPEVVYPLIERARWQRRVRPKSEAILDNIAHVFHVPDAGVRLDRAMKEAVPAQVAEDIEDALDNFIDAEPRIDLDAEPAASQEPRGPSLQVSGASLKEIVAEAPAEKGLTRLTSPDPIRFLQGDLRDLWQEAITSMRTPGKAKAGHRTVPVGPYRLAVIPSVRGRSAGTIAIQGMHNKQIEMLTPSIRLGGAGTKPIAAVWVYQDSSLAIAYIDFKNNEQFILWHAPNAQQFNFSGAADLNHLLFNLGLEAPDQLDRALTKKFRPRNPV